jgi:15-cis-phytoene synthase
MQDAFIHCEALVRAADKDRFLATLFAPAEHRAAIFALYAFNLEIARTREVTRAPLAGEIRLQWWSDVLGADVLGADVLGADVLGADGRGAVEGHPVAAALLATIAKHGLERKRLAALVDARRFDLYDEPMRTLADFETYADAASANLIALCGQILDPLGKPNIAELAHHAGIAHAVAGLLNAFAVHARRGQLYVPVELLERHGSGRQDVLGGRASVGLCAALAEVRLIARRHLSRARELLPAAPAVLIPAFLPVALAPVTLARMERVDYDPFVPVEILPWRRQWIIWRAARRPDRIFRQSRMTFT